MADVLLKKRICRQKVTKTCIYEVHFLQRSSNASANMGVVGGNTTCKSKISNLWSKLLIKKNVASFDISMNDSHSTTSM